MLTSLVHDGNVFHIEQLLHDTPKCFYQTVNVANE